MKTKQIQPKDTITEESCSYVMSIDSFDTYFEFVFRSNGVLKYIRFRPKDIKNIEQYKGTEK